MLVHNVCTVVCTQLCTSDLSFMTFPKVYTMWDNLHKTNGMDVGQIGFHKQKAVRKIRLASRENAIVNRLNKTKVICSSKLTILWVTCDQTEKK